MSVDTAIFLQSALNMTRVEELAPGLWRIYSKLGCGFSDPRKWPFMNDTVYAEIVSNAYACLPALHVSDTPSYEFVVSARGSVGNDPDLTKVQAAVLAAYQGAVGALVSGKLV
jgi:hypothetical protein